MHYVGLALYAEGLGVAVIPIRETEAWTLVDGDAIRQVFGTTLSDSQLGIPRGAGAVESALDPKALLRSALAATNPPGRKRRQSVSPMLNALGESVSLERLRELSAFKRLEHELEEAFRELNIIHTKGIHTQI